mmetsp:Transcript_94397/g.304847  ORF Transcript_94397/g.304847 Transcript_94397/m.304847 type:complete len:269 (+) Transcript_94397:98-904(+)
MAGPEQGATLHERARAAGHQPPAMAAFDWFASRSTLMTAACEPALFIFSATCRAVFPRESVKAGFAFSARSILTSSSSARFVAVWIGRFFLSLVFFGVFTSSLYPLDFKNSETFCLRRWRSCSRRSVSSRRHFSSASAAAAAALARSCSSCSRSSCRRSSSARRAFSACSSSAFFFCCSASAWRSRYSELACHCTALSERRCSSSAASSSGGGGGGGGGAPIPGVSGSLPTVTVSVAGSALEHGAQPVPQAGGMGPGRGATSLPLRRS